MSPDAAKRCSTLDTLPLAMPTDRAVASRLKPWTKWQRSTSWIWRIINLRFIIVLSLTKIREYDSSGTPQVLFPEAEGRDGELAHTTMTPRSFS